MSEKGSNLDGYELINKNEVFFRYRSIAFSNDGMNIHGNSILFGPTIATSHRAKLIIRLVLAHRVITDLYTLERFLKRAEASVVAGFSVFDALPASIQNGMFGVFTRNVIGILCGESSKNNAVNRFQKFPTEDIEKFIKFAEFKTKLTQVTVSEYYRYKESPNYSLEMMGDKKYRDVFVELVCEKLNGLFAKCFPEYSEDTSTTAKVQTAIQEEVSNAYYQFNRTAFGKRKESSPVVTLSSKMDYPQYSTVYTLAGEEIANTLGKVELIYVDKDHREMYRSFSSCPFTDVDVELGSVHIRCPIEH